MAEWGYHNGVRRTFCEQRTGAILTANKLFAFDVALQL